MPNYVQYFGSNIVECVAESWVEAEISWVVDGAGWWMELSGGWNELGGGGWSWVEVGARFSNTWKSNNAFKVKNDNGPISVFICYCSTPRWIRHKSYHVLSNKHIWSILFVSNESKKSIWYLFWINPKSIRSVEKEAKNLSKMLTVLIVIFGSDMRIQELFRDLYDDN